VSVLIATFERAALLAEAVASVRAQTFTDWECLIADDGSADDTPARLAGLLAEEPRLRCLRLAHSGSPGAVRNAALAAARGALVACLDDDDVWRPDALERLLMALDATPDAPLAFGRVERFGQASGTWPRGSLPGRVDLPRLLRGNLVPLPATLARRAALHAAGGFREDVLLSADYELWLRLARAAPLAFHDAVVGCYRVHPGSLSRRRGLEADELERLYARLEQEWRLPRNLLTPGRRNVARTRARLAPALRAALPLWWRAWTTG
jgi:glycosyltransferase involved in cell wall biosynthesis